MKETDNASAKYSQEQIQKALLSLLEKRTFESIAIKEIIFEAKVSRKTFYRNFESKMDVLKSLANMALKSYGEQISRLETESLSDFFDIVFNTAKKEKKFFTLLLRQNLFYVIQDEASFYIPKLHEDEFDGCRYFSSLSSSQTDYVIAFNIGAIWNVVRKWIAGGMKTPEDEIKDGLVKFLSSLS